MKGSKSISHKSKKPSHRHSRKFSISLSKSIGVARSPVSGANVPASYAHEQRSVMRVTAKAIRATMRRGR